MIAQRVRWLLRLPVIGILAAGVATTSLNALATAPASAGPPRAALVARTAVVPTKPPCPTNVVTPRVTQRARYVWKRFRSSGYSPAATAAVLGNLDFLSGVSPTAIALDKASAGVARWPLAQWAGYKSWAAEQGANPWSLSLQTTFLLAQLDKNPNGLDHVKFQQRKDPRGAALTFHNKLRPSGQSADTVIATRGAKAVQWMQALAGTDLSTAASDYGTYGLAVPCDPPTATLERCPTVPASFKTSFTRYTGMNWDLLSQNSRIMSRCVYVNFPRILVHGTYYGHMPDHAHAIDFMMPGGCVTSPTSRTTTTADLRMGSRLARYLFTEGSRFGIDYLIWQDRLRNPVEHSDENAWAPISLWRVDNYNNGNCTNTHFDHVHASVLY